MERSRVTYTKEQREIAVSKGLGLACIAWEDVDGSHVIWYGPVDKKTLTYVKRAQNYAIKKSLNNG